MEIIIWLYIAPSCMFSISQERKTRTFLRKCDIKRLIVIFPNIVLLPHLVSWALVMMTFKFYGHCSVPRAPISITSAQAPFIPEILLKNITVLINNCHVIKYFLFSSKWLGILRFFKQFENEGDLIIFQGRFFQKGKLFIDFI